MNESSARSTLRLRVSEDAYRGDAMFNVYVDGQQVGDTQVATASHAAGQWQDVTIVGDFDPAPHAVEVRFLNDAWGGTPDTDRNLYVDSLILGDAVHKGAAAANHAGEAVGEAAALYGTGSLVFDTTKPDPLPPPPEPAPRGSLTLRVSEDAYRGDAMFNVYVDGRQVGDTQVATASHAAGAWQDVTVSGDFDPSASHSVEVRFLNDAWGGTADTDRNLYVDSLILGDSRFAAAAATNHAGPTVEGAAALYSTGSLVFDTSAPAPTPAPEIPVTSAPPPTHTDPTGPGLSLLGVNLAGADFAGDKLPGVFGHDYTYPTHAEIDYYAGKGLDVVRLPFLWERLQPTEGGPLDAAELARMDDVVDYATAHGLKVILDPHNFGSAYGNVIGSAGTPDSAFADFWGKLAGHFAGNQDVIFGLMNEPSHQDATQWLGSANAAIAAIRGAGATTQEILVPGAYYDGAHSWVSSDNATVLGSGIDDPNHNFAFEVHQYLDSDSSGTHPDVVSPTIGADRLKDVTQWAQDTGNRLFLGEFGVSQDATSLAAMDGMLAYMDQHPVWQGATYWAAGPWWGDYMFSAEPTGLGSGTVTDKPQMAILEKYVG